MTLYYKFKHRQPGLTRVNGQNASVDGDNDADPLATDYDYEKRDMN